jgi:predicted metalloprotease with PDZ domain
LRKLTARVLRKLTIALVFVAATLGATARADVEYRVELGERAAHRAVVEMVVHGAAAPLELELPAWTPGAYELRDWGRNLTPLDASDGAGHTLAFHRVGPNAFRVTGHAAGAEVRIRYRVYAARLSDDASQLDARHAYLNGTSLFLVARGAEATPHRVRVATPAGWRLATALEEAPGGGLRAPSWEALVEAPIEVGQFAAHDVRAAERIYRVVIDGVTSVPARLATDVAAIAEAEARIVPPPYARYLILIHLDDGLGRVAALEHAASASIVVPRRSLGGGEPYEELLYVIAHELFHAFNARRLRPAELVPYDLGRPRPARSLWITEGLTEYYAFRALLRAGRLSRAQYLARLGEEATRALLAARRGLTVEEEAELAFHPPDDAAGDPDAYYARGHMVALGLDATLRAATAGRRGLDDVVRALDAQATRAGGLLPIDGERLARAVAEVGGAESAARVADFTRTPDEPARITAALAAVGLGWQTDEGAPRTIAGFAAELDAGTLRVATVAADGPAAEAGLRAGDRILRIDGAPPGERWAEDLAAKPPGTALALEAVRATRRLALTLQLETLRPLSCTIVQLPATPQVAALRDALLGR